jgi:hypothetical protein
MTTEFDLDENFRIEIFDCIENEHQTRIGRIFWDNMVVYNTVDFWDSINN